MATFEKTYSNLKRVTETRPEINGKNDTHRNNILGQSKGMIIERRTT